MTWLELFGYFGSVVVAVSLMMKSMVKLRWLNLIGATLFSIYGLLVNAYPVFALNGFIALADLYYLIIMYKTKSAFHIIETNSDDLILNKFIEFYFNDIKKFFIDFEKELIKDNQNIFIFRNMLPVGLICYKTISSDEIEIIIDYAIEDYRDLGNSLYVMSGENNYLKSKGIKKIYAKTGLKVHNKYLKKMGFILENNKYVKTL